jgi:hypothetical protein
VPGPTIGIARTYSLRLPQVFTGAMGHARLPEIGTEPDYERMVIMVVKRRAVGPCLTTIAAAATNGQMLKATATVRAVSGSRNVRDAIGGSPPDDRCESWRRLPVPGSSRRQIG